MDGEDVLGIAETVSSLLRPTAATRMTDLSGATSSRPRGTLRFLFIDIEDQRACCTHS
jgi:hypothetical protein